MSVAPDLADDLLDDSPARRGLKIVVGVVAVVVTLGAIGLLLAMTFSVQVQGQSMDPTLRQGDRLMADLFAGESDVQRFDLAGTTVPGFGPIVKRVVGMPGDQVSIVQDSGRTVVVVRPKGETVDYEVVNPAWPEHLDSGLVCCTAAGKEQATSTPVQVPEGQYWILGDNFTHSEDSRSFGFVKAEQIGATLNFRILPLSSFGSVPNDVRLVPRS